MKLPCPKCGAGLYGMKPKSAKLLIPPVGICLQCKTAWKLERSGWLRANLVFFGLMVLMVVLSLATQRRPFGSLVGTVGGAILTAWTVLQPWLWQQLLGWFAKAEGEVDLERAC